MANPGRRRWQRSWRRFRRLSPNRQVISIAATVALVGGVVYFFSAGSSRVPGTNDAVPTTSIQTGAASRFGGSNAGVGSDVVRVAFPVANLDALASNLGFAGDIEYSEQAKAIHLFVDQINDDGGIGGRKIDPIIVNFDPTNEADMRALCKQWTEGGGSVFAVLDGVGAWSGDNQLCIAQEGHTPLISQWTTVTNWTEQGAPNLWWTGPDDVSILQATVDWGLSAGLLGHGARVAVIAGDRASDQLALDDYLLPDLRRAGVNPIVRTIAANPSDPATTDSQAPLIIQQLRSAGVTSLIPLMPFNVFFPVLEAETTQGYFPRLLLSDYENSIQSALGLIPALFEKALDGQEGVTAETLGGIDDTRPESDGGYDPGVRSCFAAAQGLPPDSSRQPELLSGGTGTGPGLVPGDSPLRGSR